MELENAILFVNRIIDVSQEEGYRVHIQADDKHKELTIRIVSTELGAYAPTMHYHIRVEYYEILDAYYPTILADEWMKKVSDAFTNMISLFQERREI